MKLDLLALGAHPDDVELSAGGTLAKLVDQGYAVGIVDLTAGELGTRGTPETRAAESAAASAILGIATRENLGLPDGFFENTEPFQRQVIEAIRHYRPEVVLLNAPEDRHPDHGRAAALGRDACWLSGLRRIETQRDGVLQAPWRPKKLLHYIQDRLLKPSLIVDITGYWPRKLAAIQAYGTQVFTSAQEAATDPQTYISRPIYLQQLEARALEMGHAIGTDHGEGFISVEPLKVNDLLSLATVL
ncbi:MAG: bacillithiol biosynthesis deacetylase BshB1 [Bacteroidia bacterium]|nr:bacillithiol biosynthesis deacetylase BshB1 [Bacteroidia bacterium]